MKKDVVPDNILAAFRLEVERGLLLEQAAAVGEVRLDDRARGLVPRRAVRPHPPGDGAGAGGLAELRDDVVADLVEVRVLWQGSGDRGSATYVRARERVKRGKCASVQ